MADDTNRPLIRPDDPWAEATYASLSEALIDVPRGRYAAIAPTTGGPLPAPNWSCDPTGPEPPLGYDINEIPDLVFQDPETGHAPLMPGSIPEKG